MYIESDVASAVARWFSHSFIGGVAMWKVPV